MSNATSYICERSAEYTLVPKLIQILRKKYKQVVPIYPWISRECANLSRELHKNDKFQVLGLYPRRPKFFSADDNIVKVKVNEQIIYGSQKGLDLGIPIIAGCPIANDFWELGKCDKFLWINLPKLTINNINVLIEYSRFSNSVIKYDKYIIQNDYEILSIINQFSQAYDLGRLIQTIKDIKMMSCGHKSYVSMLFMGGYKPIYFLLK